MMPTRAPHICACGHIVAHGDRCACQQQKDRQRRRRADAKRPSARERGYDAVWQKARAEYLAAHPKCVRCGNPSTTVDHIIPHRGDMRAFWNRANWQSLCTSCHSRWKQRQERK